MLLVSFIRLFGDVFLRKEEENISKYINGIRLHYTGGFYFIFIILKIMLTNICCVLRYGGVKNSCFSLN